MNAIHPPRQELQVQLPGRLGIIDMMIACFFVSAMGAFVSSASKLEPAVSPLFYSFVRVVVNLIVLIPWLWYRQEFSKLRSPNLTSLLGRGLFGNLSLVASFFAIVSIGVGETAFLQASNAVFVALLAPLFLGERHSVFTWGAVLGSFIGIFLIIQPTGGSGDLFGRFLGITSGFCSAIGFIITAKLGTKHSPLVVVFYFCVVGLLFHIVSSLSTGLVLPENLNSWTFAIVAGLCASLAQHFVVRAYQRSPASLVAPTGYLGPVISVGMGALVLNETLSVSSTIGCILVLLFGVLMPLMKGPGSYAKPK